MVAFALCSPGGVGRRPSGLPSAFSAEALEHRPRPDPGLGDEQLLEQADGVAVGHAGDEIAGGRVQPLGSMVRASRNAVGRSRTFSHSPPRMPVGLLELGRGRRGSRRPPRTGSRAAPSMRLEHRRRSCGFRSAPPASVSVTTSVTMRADPLRTTRRRAPRPARPAGRSALQDAGPHGIVDVVIDVGDDVGHPHDLPFERAGAMLGRHADRQPVLALRVPGDAVAHLPGQVQAAARRFRARRRCAGSARSG